MITINKKTLIILITLIALSGFVVWFVYQYKQELENKTGSLPKNEQELNSSSVPTISMLKIYRNEEFGFEFQYPNDWTFHENTFYSPFSKFNLIGTASGEDVPNTIMPSLLVNIVTSDFANRAFYDLRHTALNTIVAEVTGSKYEYEFEGFPQIAVDLPFGKYRMLLGAKKQYEDIFNQILASFKFLY